MIVAKSFIVLLLFSIFICIKCFPYGTPDKCETLSLTKTNPLTPQVHDAPYVLLQTAISFKPGQVINVNIQRQTSHSTFDGFIVQALDKMTGRYIGRFLDADGLYLLDECSAVMNKDNTPKTFVNLAWVAPLTQRGDVFFRGTVIERRNKYFENLLSRLEPSRTTRIFKMKLEAFKS